MRWMIVFGLVMVMSGCAGGGVEVADTSFEFQDDGVVFSCPQDWVLDGDHMGNARCVDNSVAPMMVFDASWVEGERQLAEWNLENLEELSYMSNTSDTQDITFNGHSAKKIVMRGAVDDIEFVQEILTFNCNGKNVLIQKSYPTDLFEYTNLFDSIEASFNCEK